MLTNASDAGPALMRFPVLTENQVCVDGQLTGGKSQSENLIRQKKIMAQWAVLGVSIFDFRGVTSQVFFKNSTPKFETMSIEKSKFTACSQYNLAKFFQIPLCKILFCLLSRKF